jgi:hypothetical protein
MVNKTANKMPRVEILFLSGGGGVYPILPPGIVLIGVIGGDAALCVIGASKMNSWQLSQEDFTASFTVPHFGHTLILSDMCKPFFFGILLLYYVC